MQTTPAVVIQPRPLPIVRKTCESADLDVRNELASIVFSNKLIRNVFTKDEISQVKMCATQLVTNYEVTVVNEKKETAVIQLIRESGKRITIVNVNAPIRPSIVKIDKEVKTEVVVESTTGNQVYTTNDQTVITKDISIKHVTQNIVAQKPELIGWVPVDVQTTTHGDTKETTVVFTSEEKKSTQVTTIVNTKTNKVEVVSTEVIKKESKPRIQVISGPIIKIAQKKYTEIKEIVQNIESSVS